MPEGQIIKIEQCWNQSKLSAPMPADGSVWLFLIVEAPGHEMWTNAIRMKFNSMKQVSFLLEMERSTGVQG